MEEEEEDKYLFKSSARRWLHRNKPKNAAVK
jgi:hypothetical protein